MSQQSIDFGARRPVQSGPEKQFLIGTSGYSFQDWKGTFYPENIQNRDMLAFYAQHFGVAEINATYYRVPGPRTFEGMLKKVEPDFEFVVKTHQGMTHTRKATDEDYRTYAECITPLLDAGQLSGLLSQFPWSFKYSQANVDYIRTMRDRLPPVPLVVEFRHSSWLRDETYEFLKAENIIYSCVDEPRLNGLLPPQDVTTSEKIGYVRLHGRNAKHWWQGGALRYDYSYRNNELNDWAERLKSMSKNARKIFVLFNNCHLGQAAKNALTLMMMMGEE